MNWLLDSEADKPQWSTEHNGVKWALSSKEEPFLFWTLEGPVMTYVFQQDLLDISAALNEAEVYINELAEDEEDLALMTEARATRTEPNITLDEFEAELKESK